MVLSQFHTLLKQLFQDLNKAKEADEVGQAVKRNEDKILEIGKLFQQRGDAESLGQLVKMVSFKTRQRGFAFFYHNFAIWLCILLFYY